MYDREFTTLKLYSTGHWYDNEHENYVNGVENQNDVTLVDISPTRAKIARPPTNDSTAH
jgi:hypothetical protein